MGPRIGAGTYLLTMSAAVNLYCLQDINFPPIWATLMAFPLFAVILLPVLCFFTPVRVANRFGRPPLPSGKLKVTAALVGFILALVLVPMVARLYAPLHLQNPL
jgi:hypothetical protein